MFRSLANEVVTGDLIASLTRLDENRASNVNWNRTRLNMNLIGTELSANMSPWFGIGSELSENVLLVCLAPEGGQGLREREEILSQLLLLQLDGSAAVI